MTLLDPHCEDRQIQKLVSRVVNKNRHLFWHHRGSVGAEDLRQECMVAIFESRESFDATRATWPTWAWHICERTLIDRHRRLSSQARLETVTATGSDELQRRLVPDVVCLRREKFADEADAKSAAEEVAPSRVHRLKAKRCKHCRYWHLYKIWIGAVSGE